MKTLEKLMSKKKGEPIPEDYKNAKMSMLEALRDHMSDMMKNDLVDHKNKGAAVQVAADDKAGLAEGLDKAKDMLGSSDESSEDESEEGKEGPEAGEMGKEPGEELIADMIAHEGAEDELSPDDINQLMAMLQKMKMKKGMM